MTISTVSNPQVLP